MGKGPQTPQRKVIILPAQGMAFILQMGGRNHQLFDIQPAPTGRCPCSEATSLKTIGLVRHDDIFAFYLIAEPNRGQ